MPELLDLPPELIERISVDLESHLYQDAQNTGKTQIAAPLFRLTCRYVEQCTRCKFAERFLPHGTSTWPILQVSEDFVT